MIIFLVLKTTIKNYYKLEHIVHWINIFVDIHNEMIHEDDQQSHHNYLLYRIIKYLCHY